MCVSHKFPDAAGVVLGLQDENQCSELSQVLRKAPATIGECIPAIILLTCMHS